MTVAMSDRYYAVLVQAAGWVKDHAGDDAPEYPDRLELSQVVDNIAKRAPKPGRESSEVFAFVLDRPHPPGTPSNWRFW